MAVAAYSPGSQTINARPRPIVSSSVLMTGRSARLLSTDSPGIPTESYNGRNPNEKVRIESVPDTRDFYSPTYIKVIFVPMKKRDATKTLLLSERKSGRSKGAEASVALFITIATIP